MSDLLEIWCANSPQWGLFAHQISSKWDKRFPSYCGLKSDKKCLIFFDLTLYPYCYITAVSATQCHIYIRVGQKTRKVDNQYTITCPCSSRNSCFMYVMSHAHVMSCYMSHHILCMNMTQACERKW